MAKASASASPSVPVLPVYKKGHTEWHPKLKVKDGLVTVKCGEARITGATESEAITNVKAYADKHGWAQV